MKGLCGTCPARLTCTKLCPIALAFVKRHVGRRELLIQDMDAAIQNKVDWPGLLTKNKKELILEMYFIDRRRQSDIAHHVGVSRSYVSQVIRQAKVRIQWLIS